MYGVVFVVGCFVGDFVVVLYLFFEVIYYWFKMFCIGFVIKFFRVSFINICNVLCGFDYGYLYV